MLIIELENVPAFRLTAGMVSRLNKTYPASTGPRIRAVRLARGYEHQGRFCEKAGIPQPKLSKLENGAEKLQIDHAVLLAEALDVPVEYLVSGDVYRMPKDLLEKLGIK